MAQHDTRLEVEVRALLTVLIQREKDGIERELRERADVRNEGN